MVVWLQIIMADRQNDTRGTDGVFLPEGLAEFRRALLGQPDNRDATDLSLQVFGDLFGEEARERHKADLETPGLNSVRMLRVIISEMGDQELQQIHSGLQKNPEACDQLRVKVLEALEQRLSRADRTVIEELFGLNGQPVVRSVDGIALERGRTVEDVEQQQADALRALMGYGPKARKSGSTEG